MFLIVMCWFIISAGFTYIVGGSDMTLKITNILEIVQKGIDLGHYVIRPKYAMPLIDYQNLLNQVVLKP